MKELKILCWNVNGIRAVHKRGFLEWLQQQSPDILCLQETKARPEQLPAELRQPEGYQTFWNYPPKKGLGGVATFSKQPPASTRYDFGNGFDLEGRLIISEYPGFTLFNVYFPNGKQSPARLQYKLDFYDAFLRFADSLKEKGKKLVICGDVNTAHKEIDIARPKENQKVSGFLPVEREWMDKLVAHGYADTFRHFNQEPHQYTWWDMKTGARQRNVGWRIDYFFVSQSLLPSVSAAFIMSDVTGSDHCPIEITLRAD